MTKIEVWTRLQGDDEFLMECIVLLYKLQTAHEKFVKSTTETNRMGFNKADAPFLTEMYERITSVRHGLRLPNEHELIIAREKMLKYSQQLANIFTANDGDVA